MGDRRTLYSQHSHLTDKAIRQLLLVWQREYDRAHEELAFYQPRVQMAKKLLADRKNNRRHRAARNEGTP